MSIVRIPTYIRAEVRQRAQNRCEYCQTDERLSGIACEIDHIIPVSSGGETSMHNLWLAQLVMPINGPELRLLIRKQTQLWLYFIPGNKFGKIIFPGVKTAVTSLD